MPILRRPTVASSRVVGVPGSSRVFLAPNEWPFNKVVAPFRPIVISVAVTTALSKPSWVVYSQDFMEWGLMTSSSSSGLVTSQWAWKSGGFAGPKVPNSEKCLLNSPMELPTPGSRP